MDWMSTFSTGESPDFMPDYKRPLSTQQPPLHRLRALCVVLKPSCRSERRNTLAYGPHHITFLSPDIAEGSQDLITKTPDALALMSSLGPSCGDFIVKTMTNNIDKLVQFVRPRIRKTSNITIQPAKAPRKPSKILLKVSSGSDRVGSWTMRTEDTLIKDCQHSHWQSLDSRWATVEAGTAWECTIGN
jgi:hypothetical protein